ncbi:hypothetical protein MBLNU459_g2915t2 [Dothideomycetes sp. NU459]
MNGMQYPGHASQDSTLSVERLFGSYKGAWVAAGIAVLYCIYNSLIYFDLPLLSLSEVVWNVLVSLAPTSLVVALDKKKNPGLYSDTTGPAQSSSVTRAIKSEAMRRVFGLDNGILGALPGAGAARRASWLGGSTSRSNAPPGLGNWDNSCYQNSVLQGLSALQSLTTFLEHSDMVAAHDSNTTAGSLRETMEKLNDSSNNGRQLWTPAKLKSMSSWQQQDAQEYFSKIMDDLEKETSKALKLRSITSGLKDVEKFDAVSETSTESVSQCEGGPVQFRAAFQKDAKLKTHHNPLDGYLAQRVACLRCGFSEGLSMIPFNCLTVPLGKEYSYQVQDCLNEYTNLEEISGVECAKCTLLQQKTQLEQMTKEPDVSDSATSVVSLPGELRTLFMERLQAVRQALDDEDFSDSTLNKKCQIPKKARVSGTKTRQAVIARAPQSLVIHINRSLFDEYTGAQRKNYAEVKYPKLLDIQPWCLGRRSIEDETREGWVMDPAKSLIAFSKPEGSVEMQYVLRAAVCHYGRHENGHYICYREHPEHDKEKTDQKTSSKWWRLSDEDVSPSTEEDVLAQGGVFMLFYERLQTATRPSDSAALQIPEAAHIPTKPPAAEIGQEEETLIPPSTSDDVETPPIIVSDSRAMAVMAVAATTPGKDEQEVEASSHPLPQTRNVRTPPLMRTARNGSKASKRENNGFSSFRAVAAT